MKYIIVFLISYSIVFSKDPFYYGKDSLTVENLFDVEMIVILKIDKDISKNLKMFEIAPIRLIEFNGVCIDEIPNEIALFKNLKTLKINDCTGNSDKIIGMLPEFPKLKDLSIENTNINKFPIGNKPNDSLRCIMFTYFNDKGSPLVFTEALSKLNNLREIEINNYPQIIFEPKIQLDSLYDLKISNEFKVKTKIIGLSELFNNIKYLRTLILANSDFENFGNQRIAFRDLVICDCGLTEIPDYALYCPIEGIELSVGKINHINNKLFDMKMLHTLSLSFNQLKHFPFDRISDSMFLLVPDLTFNEFNKETFIPFNELWLDGNFIDSIPKFVDTTLKHIYEIDLSYNKRTALSPNISESGLRYYNIKSSDYNFTLPKGLFNLQFCGRLILKGYNLSEEEKERIQKHFKYAKVIFNEE